MNLIIKVSGLVFLMAGAILIFSCGTSNHKHEKNQGENQNDTHLSPGDHVYFCPMKCEGDKTYKEPGQCPVCGMDLKKLEDQDHEGHHHHDGHHHHHDSNHDHDNDQDNHKHE